MAETTTITRPAPIIEGSLTAFLKSIDKLGAGAVPSSFAGIDTSKFAPKIAAESQLQQDARTAAAGLGSLTGPDAYQAFMSPYQRDVIDATLQEFDVQAAKGIPNIAAQAVGKGVLGGGREGVQRAEYQSASDRNRAALQAQLLQQGFGEAQNLAQQAFLNQQALAANQLGLGRAQQSFLGQDVGALTTLGAQNQAQRQAQLQAQQQLAQQQLNQPLTAAQAFGSGVTSLIAGYPGQTTQVVAPSPSPIATAIGAGGTLAGIYRAFGLGDN